ncbi:hypothetical protein IT413_02420 [Candidatus Peregrinibacteria bacterium]|nr:hypothetical protein [Candidatus Peregrinibacteria bacterium]
MYNATFRSALVSLIVTAGLTACGKDAPIGPDPALTGSASPPPGMATSPPPGTTSPSAPKAQQLGTLQDLCGQSLVKDAFGGVVKSFVRFTKDGKTVVVDPCVVDGATQVSFEKFAVRGREDLLIASSVCPSTGTCWYRILDLSKVAAANAGTLKYATLDQLKLAGRYKDGETTTAIPGDALFTIGALVDDRGQPTAQTVRYITTYKPAPVPDGGYLTVKRYEEDMGKLDGRLAKIESNTATLMANYSDWLRAKEAKAE